MGEEQNKPMSYKEKTLLSLGINMLMGPSLIEAAEIVRQNEPPQAAGDEVELDFENMNPTTLQLLKNHVINTLQIESLEALSNTSPKHSDEEGEFDNDRGLQENRNSPQR
ncbi:bromodomain-containing protein 3-like [Hyposmocoma kahamanoa]|uniref:bromodomain-containing protein 3-like n=1 Tax=Hyposmocoma kahamanoa TaxID=1477025 RepID=UPI000E6D8ADE|nr:bromodomain-containing protein 3-like [Hyposmocoma kahamanoa]